MTAPKQDANALVDLVRKRFPDAVRLARAVSLATRIEPELLRQARLKLLPDVDAGAEADLWFSPLVQSSTPLALVLLPDVADLLRRQLAQSKESLRRSWELLREVHRNAPAAIKLEEKVTWQALSGDARAQEAVEKDLLSVVSAIAIQNRTGLARWALRALPRLPAEARQTKAAAKLVLTAAAHLGAWQMLEGQVNSETLPSGFLSELRVVLPPDLKPVPVGVRLLEDRAEIAVLTQSVSASRHIVEFSTPPFDDNPESVITVPGTNPLLLEVSWGEDSNREVRHLSLYQGRTETVEVGAGDVRIRTASGDTYTLREDARQDSPPVPQSPNPALVRVPRPPIVGYVTRHDEAGRDIAERLKAELRSKRQRLVAMWGAGGVGKSVVAAEVARRLLDVPNQRVVWLSAEGRSDFNLSVMLDEIATQLGHPDLRTLASDAKFSGLMSLLNSAPTLIVFDQFDTVLPEERTRCLDFLKRAGCSALLTTIERITEAYNLDLGVMSFDEAREFLDRLIRRANNPRAFNNLDQRRLIEVSERNPLVMQWVVAQIDLAQNPDEVLSELARGEGDAAIRVFERSFNLPLLGDDGRAVLLALSLFVPGASRQALAAVADFGDDLERLNEAAQRLAALQLVKAAAGSERLSVEGLIRNLLQTRMSVDKRAEDFRSRFAEYFLGYAESHHDPTPENYDALEGEFENLLDAMDVGYGSKDFDSVIRICIAISEFLDVRGYWEESLRRIQQSVNAAHESKHLDMLPRLSRSSANIFLRRGEFSEAERAYRFALEGYRQANDEKGVATSLRHLGTIALEQRKPDEAARLYNEGLSISRKLGDQSAIADNLHNLAIVHQVKGDLGEARRLYQESLAISQSLGDQPSSAISLHQLGVIAQESGEFDEARRLLEESLGIKQKLGDHNGTASSFHQLGLLMKEMGDIGESERWLREALAIFEHLGSPIANEVRQDLESLKANISSQEPSSQKSKKSASKKSMPQEKMAPTGSGKKIKGNISTGGGAKAVFKGGGADKSRSAAKKAASKAGSKGGYKRSSGRSYR